MFIHDGLAYAWFQSWGESQYMSSGRGNKLIIKADMKLNENENC